MPLVHNGVYHVPFPGRCSPSLEPMTWQADLELDFRLHLPVEAVSSLCAVTMDLEVSIRA